MLSRCLPSVPSVFFKITPRKNHNQESNDNIIILELIKYV